MLKNKFLVEERACPWFFISCPRPGAATTATPADYTHLAFATRVLWGRCRCNNLAAPRITCRGDVAKDEAGLGSGLGTQNWT